MFEAGREAALAALLGLVYLVSQAVRFFAQTQCCNLPTQTPTAPRAEVFTTATSCPSQAGLRADLLLQVLALTEFDVNMWLSSTSGDSRPGSLTNSNGLSTPIHSPTCCLVLDHVLLCQQENRRAWFQPSDMLLSFPQPPSTPHGGNPFGLTILVKGGTDGTRVYCLPPPSYRPNW